MTNQKIILTKDDAAKDLAGFIASEEAIHITSTIPKFSKIAEAKDAFLTAKKIADALGKTVSIESVDDGILAAAQAAGIPAENPFFSPTPSAESAPAWEEPAARFEDGPEDGPAPLPVAMPVVAKVRRPAPRPAYKRVVTSSDDDDGDISPRRPRRPLRSRIIWGAVFVLVLVPGWLVAFRVLPQADIVVETEKEQWSFNGLLPIEKNGPVPSHIVSDRKNAQMSFPALGKKVVSRKAEGKITVYNAYSSQPQQLVATTRFETPDGKIVRLASNVTIPGAKIANGVITPSSIEADVIADKPGVAYNLSAPKLVIPGFKGTAKFSGFYGAIPAALSGGFTGEAAYPTDDDVKAAKAKVAEVLEKSITSQIAAAAGAEYTVVPGSARTEIRKMKVDTAANDRGEFSVFAEAETQAIAFKESDLVGYFASKMKAELEEKRGSADYVFKETHISYDTPTKVDFAAERMTLPVNFESVAERPVDVARLRTEVAGKSKDELNAAIIAIPGVSSAQISLWPRYVRTVPRNPSPENLSITIK